MSVLSLKVEARVWVKRAETGSAGRSGGGGMVLLPPMLGAEAGQEGLKRQKERGQKNSQVICIERTEAAEKDRREKAQNGFWFCMSGGDRCACACASMFVCLQCLCTSDYALLYVNYYV